MPRISRLVIQLALCFVLTAGCGADDEEIEFIRTESGQSANVVVSGGHAYVTLAQEGLGIVDATTGALQKVIAPPAGTASVDDLAVADGLLFVLDARSPGFLSVLSLADPAAPVVVGEAVQVPVDPFAGVSAGGGRVVVSGGTSQLTTRGYAADGTLSAEVAEGDFGQGQPDVLMAPDGAVAYVSTHFQDDDFGLTIIALPALPAAPPSTETFLIPGAGFTPGGAQPANFPIESALAGNTLVMATGAGLAVFTVGGDKATLHTTLPLGVHAVSVDIEGKTAAVVGSEPAPTLVLVDISDPAAPKVTSTKALTGTPTGVALTPTHALVANHTRGVQAVAR